MFALQFGIPGGPELLILLVIGLIIPFSLAYYVYTDAIGRGDDDAVPWAVVVGMLTLVTFFGGLVVLAVYIWQRE